MGNHSFDREVVMFRFFRSFWIIPVFAFSVCAFSAFSFAQFVMYGDVVLGLEAEQPLTQKDIDAYVKFVPEVKAAKKKGVEVSDSVFEKCGVTPQRATLIMSKVLSSYPLCDISYDEEIHTIFPINRKNAMYPTKAEIDLVRKNKLAIDALYAEK